MCKETWAPWARHSGPLAPDPGCRAPQHLSLGTCWEEAEGPRLRPAPALPPLPRVCWNSREGLNESTLIAGDSFGPDSVTELGKQEGET